MPLSRTHRSLLASILVLLAMLAGPQASLAGRLGHHASAPITITYWNYWTGTLYGGIQHRLVKEFNASHPAVQVKVIDVPWDKAKFLTSVAAGRVPDVLGLGEDQISLGARGATLDLTGLIKASTLVRQQDYWPAVWSLCTFRGHVYCLPFGTTTLALAWNKDLFKKAGLDPNKPPRTWAELWADAAKLTLRDAQGHITQLGFSPWTSGAPMVTWGWALGGSYYDLVQNRPTLDTPANVKALEWEVSWAKKYGSADIDRFVASYSSEAPYGVIKYGARLGMHIAPSFELSVQATFQPNLHYGVAPFGLPLPTAATTPYGVVPSTEIFGLAAGTKHPQEAWSFLEWLDARVGEWCKSSDDISPRKADVGIKPIFANPHDTELYTIFAKQMTQPRVYVQSGGIVDTAYTVAVRAAEQAAIHGKMTPYEALHTQQLALQKEVQQALAHAP